MGKKVTPHIRYTGTPTLEVLEGADHYNLWIAQTFLPYIQSPIIELGAGIGNITKHFLEKGQLIATDNENSFLEILQKKYQSYKNISTQRFDITKSPPSSLKNAFKTAVAINVLEHIEDDTQALKHISQTLQKRGKILLLIPAKRFAYNKLDKELGHFRRYEKEELEHKLDQSGFIVEKIFFFNIVGLLSWITRDFISQKGQITKGQMQLFDWLVPVLKLLETKFIPPVGISLIAIARKK